LEPAIYNVGAVAYPRGHILHDYLDDLRQIETADPRSWDSLTKGRSGKRRSMMRIMARRMNAATVVA
jgi:hypothetical protein